LLKVGSYNLAFGGAGKVGSGTKVGEKFNNS